MLKLPPWTGAGYGQIVLLCILLAELAPSQLLAICWVNPAINDSHVRKRGIGVRESDQ
jgi:hypothetical protein